MTAPLVDTLAEVEFDIPCDWPHCESTAIVMQKGCGDTSPFALCTLHYGEMRVWFASHSDAACSVCYRPFMNYSTHYEVWGL